MVSMLFVEFHGPRTALDSKSQETFTKTCRCCCKYIQGSGTFLSITLLLYKFILSIHIQVSSSPEEGKSFLTNKDCWICYDSEKEEPLITPCKCTGDVSSVHHECLRRWLVESCAKSDELLKCKVCNATYEIEKTNK